MDEDSVKTGLVSEQQIQGCQIQEVFSLTERQLPSGSHYRLGFIGPIVGYR
jgi:hypothetical protein